MVLPPDSADDQPQATAAQAEDPQAAHDVLAAEAFAMPAADPDLHHGEPVVLPDDPSGDTEPHDILAAEEFPLPAGRPTPRGMGLGERPGGWARLAVEVAFALLLVRRVLRRRG